MSDELKIVKMSNIPIMWPKLPLTSQVTPYLNAIDASRIYSNYGPLVLSLEERLAARFGLAKEMITTVANATQGLTLALAAMAAKPGSLCILPAWTFIASAHAVLSAGLIPYFVDVDPQTWAIDPDGVDDVIARAPAEVGAIMPVVPFGRPIDVKAWDRYRARTGLPVVIDAAAGFDSLDPCKTPSVVSLHATKVVGIGEGGFVVTTDETLIKGIRARANFGFNASRMSIATSTNAKLSEYHAAVAHAALDEWPSARAEWMAIAASYRNLLQESNRIRYQPGFGTSWIASTCLLEMPDTSISDTERALADAGVETRRWWGDGAHLHPSTARYPRTALPVTESLAKSTLSVPFYRDLGQREIETVTATVRVASARYS
jgi:dTDP-4-amino-4,6-dideoxygalactose transaminase